MGKGRGGGLEQGGGCRVLCWRGGMDQGVRAGRVAEERGGGEQKTGAKRQRLPPWAATKVTPHVHSATSSFSHEATEDVV